MAKAKTAKQLVAYSKQRKPGSQAARGKSPLPPMVGLPGKAQQMGDLTAWATPNKMKKIRKTAKGKAKAMFKV